MQAPDPSDKPHNRCDDCGAVGPTIKGLCGWCRRAQLHDDDDDDE